jgi:hypothetical protein
MNLELTEDAYRLRTEKVLTLLTTAALTCLWWQENWGNYYSQTEYYRGSIEIGICILSIFVGFRIFSLGLVGSGVAMAVICLAYNPFLPLKINSQNWAVVHFVSGCTALWVVWRLFKASSVMTPEKIRKINLAQARADAIEEGLANGQIDREAYDDFMNRLTGGKK